MLVRIKPPGTPYCSKIVTSYPKGSKSLATVSDAGPAPMQAMRLPFFTAGALGSSAVMSSRLSEATRFSRQMATGFSSIRPRRQAGSQGRSQTLPKMPGKTLDSRFTM